MVSMMNASDMRNFIEQDIERLESQALFLGKIVFSEDHKGEATFSKYAKDRLNSTHAMRKQVMPGGLATFRNPSEQLAHANKETACAQRFHVLRTLYEDKAYQRLAHLMQWNAPNAEDCYHDYLTKMEEKKAVRSEKEEQKKRKRFQDELNQQSKKSKVTVGADGADGAVDATDVVADPSNEDEDPVVNDDSSLDLNDDILNSDN